MNLSDLYSNYNPIVKVFKRLNLNQLTTDRTVISDNSSAAINFNAIEDFDNIILEGPGFAGIKIRKNDGGPSSTNSGPYIRVPIGTYHYKMEMVVTSTGDDARRASMVALRRLAPVTGNAQAWTTLVPFFGPTSDDYNNATLFNNDGFFNVTTATDIGVIIVRANTQSSTSYTGGGGYRTSDSSTRWSSHPNGTSLTSELTLTLIKVK